MLRHRLFRSRSPYLDRLARHPLFADVAAHLVPMLGQALESVTVPAATRAVLRAGDVVIVVDGHGVMTRDGVPTMAVRSGAAVDVPHDADPSDSYALVATAPLHCLLLARRDVDAVRRIAPALDRALTAARVSDPDREPSSVSRSGSAGQGVTGELVEVSPDDESLWV